MPVRYTVFSLARRIGIDTLKRLRQPTKDNFIGFAIAVTAVLIEARIHRWSLGAIRSNFWETVALPVIFVACVLIAVHIYTAAWRVYNEERVAFQNALGGITKVPPFPYCWRHYLVLLTYLLLPGVTAYFAWGTIHAEVEASQEPVLYLQPDLVPANPDGSFSLMLVNSGPDVDYIEIQDDYFVALKKNRDIRIERVFTIKMVLQPAYPPCGLISIRS
jgi:hypothetical protein